MKEEELCDVDENDGMIFSLNADETFYLGVALRVAVDELSNLIDNRPMAPLGIRAEAVTRRRRRND